LQHAADHGNFLTHYGFGNPILDHWLSHSFMIVKSPNGVVNVLRLENFDATKWHGDNLSPAISTL
jgi:hypothetical protein